VNKGKEFARSEGGKSDSEESAASVGSAKKSTERSKSVKPIPKGCGWCKGKPWVDYSVDKNGIMGRCSCAKGKWLKAKDMERAGRV